MPCPTLGQSRSELADPTQGELPLRPTRPGHLADDVEQPRRPMSAALGSTASAPVRGCVARRALSGRGGAGSPTWRKLVVVAASARPWSSSTPPNASLSFKRCGCPMYDVEVPSNSRLAGRFHRQQGSSAEAVPAWSWSFRPIPANRTPTANRPGAPASSAGTSDSAARSRRCSATAPTPGGRTATPTSRNPSTDSLRFRCWRSSGSSSTRWRRS